ncbi:MAG: hypothetical protein CVU84_01660 [Firmicutes bacterium HGW-Firmicutes-1]|jgi:predicted heme/steroid binding protein|nr:MAG: hypothetical protein CVU84_01660 [Firmicutes bacterium HGW-Firmicutes-1]
MSINNNDHLEIQDIKNRIKYYRHQQMMALDILHKMYLEDLIYDELYRLDQFLYHISQNTNRNDLREVKVKQQQQEFTLDELAQYDGSNGKPTYVAVSDVIYDVSLEATWGGGSHFSLLGGKDLTSSFNSCHDTQQILEKLPIVGVLKKGE